MIHSSYFKPKIYPFGGTDAPAEIDRLQDLSTSVALDRTKIEEIGRDGLVDWKKSIPNISLNLRQLEYDSIEFYQKLANNAETKIEWTDFKTSMVDLAGFETDDSGSFLSTIWYPNFRLSSFSVNIGDPDALIERSFVLMGEDEYTLKNSNKYLIYKEYTGTTNGSEGFSVTNPVVVGDPDHSGQYIMKVVRVRAGTATKLTHGTDWSCDGSTLTVNDVLIGDLFKAYYSAASYISSTEPFVANNSNVGGIAADSASIYLTDSNGYLYRLQSVSCDVSLNRFDQKEIGNKEVVARGVRDVSCRVTLGRILETWTIDEVLRGVAGLNFGKIDVRNFADNMTLIIKLYTSNSKATFSHGYKFTNLAPVSLDNSIPLNDYVRRNVTLECESGFVTSVEGNL